MPARIVNIQDIARSPDDVFDYLADLGNELHWNPDCVLMERLTDGPVRVGTRFRAKWKQGPIVYTEVKAFDRPNRWVYENGGPISCLLTVTLAPLPNGGTRLTSQGDWTAHGWMRLMFPIFIRVMRGAEKQVMTNAKEALEGGADRS
jgi:hypothetical protein